MHKERPFLGSYFYIFILLFAYTQNEAFSNETWHHIQFDSRSLKQGYQSVKQKYTDDKLAEIFSPRNLNCEIGVLAKLKKLDKADVKFAVLRASYLSLIDDLETEILMSYALTYEKTKKKRPEFALKVNSGQGILSDYFQKFEDESRCLSRDFNELSEKVVSSSRDKDFNALSELNSAALKEGRISKHTYFLLETLVHMDSKKDQLSIDDYRKKKQMLKRNGLKVNSAVSKFHIDTRREGEPSLRYRLYANFSALQIYEMLKLITRLKDRILKGSTEILFLESDGSISEKLSLSPVEQLHLSLKMYERERIKLIQSTTFDGVTFDYRELITTAFEMSKIDGAQAEGLLSLQKEIKEKSLLQKIMTQAERFDFVVSAIAGPTAGFVYTLSVGIANNYINKPRKGPKYEHDLFFGNCEMKL